MVQWLGLHGPSAGGTGSIPGWGTGSLTYQVAALKKEKILEEAERPEQDAWRLNQSV